MPYKEARRVPRADKRAGGAQQVAEARTEAMFCRAVCVAVLHACAPTRGRGATRMFAARVPQARVFTEQRRYRLPRGDMSAAACALRHARCVQDTRRCAAYALRLICCAGRCCRCPRALPIDDHARAICARPSRAHAVRVTPPMSRAVCRACIKSRCARRMRAQ